MITISHNGSGQAELGETVNHKYFHFPTSCQLHSASGTYHFNGNPFILCVDEEAQQSRESR